MRDRIAAALKSALSSPDQRRAATLRLVQAAVHDRDIASRKSGKDRLTDDEIAQILTRMIKQREQSVRTYEENGQTTLAEQEREESRIIRELLPEPLGQAAVEKACARVIEEVSAHGLRDVGRCINALKAKYPGRIDLGKASGIVKDMLR